VCVCVCVCVAGPACTDLTPRPAGNERHKGNPNGNDKQRESGGVLGPRYTTFEPRREHEGGKTNVVALFSLSVATADCSRSRGCLLVCDTGGNTDSLRI